MPDSRKIATCCYCGTRSVLVFDRARHELACAACGAPLHDMKAMRQPPEQKPKKTEEPITSRRRLPEFPREYPRGARGGDDDWRARRRKPVKKRRKPLMRRIVEELWDGVEDIFD